MKKINQTDLNILIENHNLYLKSITDTNSKGQRLILDGVDFTNNDLSKLNFVDVYVTSSLFTSQMLQNANFGGSELYDCSFTNVVFDKCNFGKTILNYSVIAESKFLKCNLVEIETLECNFEKLLFNNCSLSGAFSNCTIKNAIFEECTFNYPEFWKCVIENSKIVNYDELDLKNIISNVNIGTIEEPIFVENQDALKYLESRLTIE